jgi:hypothetical protein
MNAPRGSTIRWEPSNQDTWKGEQFGSYMGGNIFPIPPERIVLTDRVTGASWLLGVSNSNTLQLTAAPSRLASDMTLYLPFEEPVSNSRRLFAANGTLGSEPAPYAASDPPIILATADPNQLGVVTLSSSGVTLTVIARP